MFTSSDYFMFVIQTPTKSEREQVEKILQRHRAYLVPGANGQPVVAVDAREVTSTPLGDKWSSEIADDLARQFPELM